MGDASDRLAEARTQFEREAFDRAIDRAMQALAEGLSSPERAQAYMLVARCFDCLHMHTAALHHCHHAIDVDSELAEAHCWRGWSAFQLERDEQALADFARAIELDPELARTYYHRGELYKTTGALEQAIEDFSRALDDPEVGLEALFLRGCCHLDLEQREEARRDFEHAAERGHMRSAFAAGTEFSVDTPQVSLVLARFHLQNERTDDAIACLERALDAGLPSEREVWMELGRAHRLAGSNERAIEAFRKAAALAPGEPVPRAELGYTLYEMKRDREGESELLRAVAADPDHPLAHRYLGELYLAAERDKDAYASLTRAIELDDTRGLDFYRRAVVHGRLGDREAERADLIRAEQRHFERAREVRLSKFDPELATDFLDAGTEALSAGQPTAALEQLVRAAAILERRTSAHGDWAEQQLSVALENIGIAKIQLGDKESARIDLRRAVELRSWHVEGWLDLARLCEELDLEEQAREARDRADALTGPSG